MNQLREIRRKKGQAALIFKIEEKVNGNIKKYNEGYVIKDPKNGKHIANPKDIKKTSTIPRIANIVPARPDDIMKCQYT